MKVSEYCSKEAVFVRANESPLDAALAMRKNNVGCVVIVDERLGKLVPIGMLTDRDITVEIVAEEVNPLAVSVGDLVCKPVVSVSKQDDLNECLMKMKKKGLRNVPVVDCEGSLVGILAIDDYLELMAEQFHYLAGLFRNGGDALKL